MRSLILLLALTLVSCGNEPDEPIKSLKFCSPSALMIQPVSNEMEKMGIPHQLKEENDLKCINYAPQYSENFKEVEAKILGENPPAGLSLNMDEQHDEMLALLKAKGVNAWSGHLLGRKWIAWRYEDHDKAETILQLDPKTRELLRRLRNAQPFRDLD